AGRRRRALEVAGRRSRPLRRRRPARPRRRGDPKRRRLGARTAAVRRAREPTRACRAAPAGPAARRLQRPLERRLGRRPQRARGDGVRGRRGRRSAHRESECRRRRADARRRLPRAPLRRLARRRGRGRVPPPRLAARAARPLPRAPLPAPAGPALDANQPWWSAPADAVHVAAASVWLGGLVAFGLAVPVAARVLGPMARTRLYAAAATRFSRLALAAVLALGATGLLRAFGELTAVSQA